MCSNFPLASWSSAISIQFGLTPDKQCGLYSGQSLRTNRFYIQRDIRSLELSTHVQYVVCAAGSAAVIAGLEAQHIQSATDMWLCDLQRPPELFPTSSFFFVDFQGTPCSRAAPIIQLWPAVVTLMQSLCKAYVLFVSHLPPFNLPRPPFYLLLHLFTT